MNKRSGTESRKKIINAAMDVFFRHGYAESNIRDIAKKAGISVGSIYLYFKNKEELYKAIISDKRREMAAMTEKTVEQAKSATETLSGFLRLHLEHALKHKEFILLHIREHGFTFGIKEKREFSHSQISLLEKVILKGIRSGEFRRCNARETAKLILGSLKGIILSVALDDDGIVDPKMVVDFIFQGLLCVDKKALKR
jgi:AcrR family transcriptional regulator